MPKKFCFSSLWLSISHYKSVENAYCLSHNLNPSNRFLNKTFYNFGIHFSNPQEKTTPAISIAIPTEQQIRGLCLYDPEQLETHVTLSTPHNPTIRSSLGREFYSIYFLDQKKFH